MENNILQSTSKRPLGVTLAALILVFWGITVCLVVVLLSLDWLRGVHVQFGIVSDILGVANLPLAWGVWKLKRWAYPATLFLQGAMLLNYTVLTTLTPGSEGAILVPVLILIYFLLSQKTRTAFRAF